MDENIVIHIIYCVFTLPLLLNNFIGNHAKDRATTLMNRIFICSYIKIGFAILEILVNGKPEYDMLHLVFLCGEFGMGVPIMICYVSYIKELVDDKRLFPQKLAFSVKILGATIIAIDILSVFFPLVFYMNNGVYSRGLLFNFYHFLFMILIAMI